ncbi:glycosyltransferase family 2 protein [Candidatus Roizmanbacteria bacterium]|nr:glycosyltransferase family 2 protein [Candidatus Roizmanbacteria bacterium]
MKVDFSIIILSYNTKDLTEKCLTSLFKIISKNKAIRTEIIVVDNASTDGTIENLKFQSRLNRDKNKNLRFRLILNKKNLGYPKGNNQALKIAKGKYILFLNSDVIIDDLDFEEIMSYLENHPRIAVLTVKVKLSDGNIDPAAHRGFPTVWSSFCYFIGLEDLFKNVPFVNRIFGRYHLPHLNLREIHDIDSPSGAFYLTKKDILKKVGGFDESFFMYGEDLDLSFRIKKLGYKIVYYPRFEVLHLKSASGLEKKDPHTRLEARYHFFEAMEIFYKKHYEKKHNKLINNMIYFFIKVLKNIG